MRTSLPKTLELHARLQAVKHSHNVVWKCNNCTQAQFNRNVLNFKMSSLCKNSHGTGNFWCSWPPLIPKKTVASKHRNSVCVLSKCKRVNFRSFKELNEGQLVFEWKTTGHSERSESCYFDKNIPFFLEWTIHFHTHFRLKFYNSKMCCLIRFTLFHISTRFTFREYAHVTKILKKYPVNTFFFSI